MEVVPGIDHTLYLQSAREAVLPMLADQARAIGARSTGAPSLAPASSHSKA